MTNLIPPAKCQTMAELRQQIDAIDKDLIDLLTLRSGYIDRAVDLKRIENLPARTTGRVAEVLDNVARLASERGLDPDLARGLWAQMIEWAIERESRELGKDPS